MEESVHWPSAIEYDKLFYSTYVKVQSVIVMRYERTISSVFVRKSRAPQNLKNSKNISHAACPHPILMAACNTE